MQDVATYLNDYDAYHRTMGNKLCHVFGIPVIVLSALGMLDHVVFFEWNIPIVHASLGLFIWMAAIGFYVYLHTALGLSLLVTTSVLYVIGASLSMPVLIALQVFGWVVQFVGHAVWEKKQPAFAKNLVHLLIGPAYIQNYLLKIHKERD